MKIIEIDAYPEPPRLIGKVHRRPITVDLRWPNALGNEPDDALGKHVTLDAPPDRGEYEVAWIQTGKLVLIPFPS